MCYPKNVFGGGGQKKDVEKNVTVLEIQSEQRYLIMRRHKGREKAGFVFQLHEWLLFTLCPLECGS